MKYYSAREAAKILGVAHTTVIRWIEKGELKSNIRKTLYGVYYQIPEDVVLRLKKRLEAQHD